MVYWLSFSVPIMEGGRKDAKAEELTELFRKSLLGFLSPRKLSLYMKEVSVSLKPLLSVNLNQT